ncbi:MAG: galactose-1-phosphate uridylyltransferase, partial [Terriglobales bacterium]
ALADYRQAHGRCLLCDYMRRELADGERVVCENESFVALVPFWAYWPFELLLLSKEHVAGLAGLDAGARARLADLLRRVNVRYDHVFESPFPVSWGWHLPPCEGEHAACHLHAHFFPPLLRSASVRKFTAAYELLAMPQRDLSPESAADLLRALSDLPGPEAAP